MTPKGPTGLEGTNPAVGKEPGRRLARPTNPTHHHRVRWSKLGQSLHLFNKLWLRRVLGQSATVILFTDGLERDGTGELAQEMGRLKRSCRRLIWSGAHRAGPLCLGILYVFCVCCLP